MISNIYSNKGCNYALLHFQLAFQVAMQQFPNSTPFFCLQGQSHQTPICTSRLSWMTCGLVPSATKPHSCQPLVTGKQPQVISSQSTTEVPWQTAQSSGIRKCYPTILHSCSSTFITVTNIPYKEILTVSQQNQITACLS